MSTAICEECLHIMFDKICRCTEDKVIGCMYIGLVEGCIYYDIQTKKRCKNRVVETENGKMFMCIQHASKKKVHIKTDSKKTTTESKKKSDESRKSESEKKCIEVEKKVRQKRKIVKKIKE